MSDKYFIDTNIFVYAFDKRDKKKRQVANSMIKKALSDHVGCISFHNALGLPYDRSIRT